MTLAPEQNPNTPPKPEIPAEEFLAQVVATDQVEPTAETGALSVDVEPATEQPSTRRRAGIIAAAATAGAVLLGGGTAAGVAIGNANSAPITQEDPSDSQNTDDEDPAVVNPGPSPSDLPSSSPTSIPIETQPPQQSAVERLTGISLVEFQALDRQEQLILVWEMLRESKKIPQHFGNANDMLFEFNPYDIASIENGGNEIVQQFWYLKQLALNQTGDQFKHDLDQELAQKSLAGAYYYTEGVRTNDYLLYSDVVAGLSERTYNANRYTVTNTGELQQGTDRDGNPLQYRDITYFTDTGSGYKGRFVWNEFTNAHGERVGLWQLLAQVGPDDSF